LVVSSYFGDISAIPLPNLVVGTLTDSAASLLLVRSSFRDWMSISERSETIKVALASFPSTSIRFTFFQHK
jgi:hypothetical protein